MKKPVRFDAGAQLELMQTSSWYEERAPGLGDEFITRIEEVVVRLEQLPASGAYLLSAEEQIRFALVSGFPYMLVYRELEHDVRVLAVAHVRRKPGYWRDRDHS